MQLISVPPNPRARCLTPPRPSTADNFTAEFPVDATMEERMLLMAAVYFIDFLRFEQKQNNNQNNA